MPEPTSLGTDSQLSRLEARLDRMEATLDRLAGVLDHFEPNVAIAFDVLDEESRKAAERGVDIDRRLREAGELVEKLTAPDKLASLGRMVDRLEALEFSADLAAGAEDHVAMAFDIVDEQVRGLQARGVDVDLRLQLAGRILEVATDPSRLETLTGVLERLDKLEPAIDAATKLEDHVAIAFDTVDELVDELGSRGVDLDARTRAVMAFAEQATAPEKMEALAKMLSQIERLEPMVAVSASAVDNIAIAFDIFDEETGALAAEGVDFGQAVSNGLILFRTLAHWVTSPAFQRLLDSGLISPQGLGKATELSEMVLRRLHEEPEQVGLFKVMGSLSDPDMQRFAGFSIALGRSIGTLLGKPSSCMIAAEAK